MEYTEAEKALIESTQWPSTEEGATADALIVHGARLAVSWSAQSHELMVKAYALDKESPEHPPALRAYMDALIAMIAEAQVVDLLVQVQKENPSQAEELAQRLWGITEDGGVLTEFMWEYLDERGVDADAVFALTERDARSHSIDRCVKCGGPDGFHDPACVVHPMDHQPTEREPVMEPPLEVVILRYLTTNWSDRIEHIDRIVLSAGLAVEIQEHLVQPNRS